MLATLGARLRAATLLVSLPFAAPAAFAQAAADAPIFGPGYMDVGATLGLGGIGSAGLAFGGRFERALRTLPEFGNGVLGIQASVDTWSYDDRFVGTDYDFRYLNIGVTANYHFPIKTNPKIDPFLGLGLGNASVSTSYAGSYSSGIYFIGRAGIRYFYTPRLAVYADAGAGASTLNLGAMFSLGGAR